MTKVNARQEARKERKTEMLRQQGVSGAEEVKKEKEPKLDPEALSTTQK